MKVGKKLSLVFLVLGVLALCTFVYVITHQDDIIIDSGIRTFRTLRWLSAGAAALLLAAWGVPAAIRRFSDKKSQQLKLEESRRSNEEKALLSYRDGRLDEAGMRSLVARCFRDYNGSAAGTVAETPEAAQFRRYLDQMDAMNICQAQLHTLLELNGASDLNQTEEMMDALEQNLFMNLRKSLNWANALRPQDSIPEDIFEKLRQVESDNSDLLDTARELLTQLTDYINHQGDSKAAEETAGAFIEQLRLMVKIKEGE